jgi:diadenosine tetraphosphatase ApaH/serine/threonine PP2A family protein phosphatase
MPKDEWARLKQDFQRFYSSLESHLILDGGHLVVAHAGMTAELMGRMGVRRFALYGETKSEIDGYARRTEPLWAMRYRARPKVIYGHVAVVEPKRVQNTLNIDTGCVYGGKLTALRYPEGEMISVDAARTYFEPLSPPPEKKKRKALRDAQKVAEPAGEPEIARKNEAEEERETAVTPKETVSPEERSIAAEPSAVEGDSPPEKAMETVERAEVEALEPPPREAEPVREKEEAHGREREESGAEAEPPLQERAGGGASAEEDASEQQPKES